MHISHPLLITSVLQLNRTCQCRISSDCESSVQMYMTSFRFPSHIQKGSPLQNILDRLPLKRPSPQNLGTPTGWLLLVSQWKSCQEMPNSQSALFAGNSALCEMTCPSLSLGKQVRRAGGSCTGNWRATGQVSMALPGLKAGASWSH